MTLSHGERGNREAVGEGLRLSNNVPKEKLEPLIRPSGTFSPWEKEL